MERNTKKCFRCLFFERYFTKGVKSFQQTQHGWCRKRHETVASIEQCDRFVQKPPPAGDRRFLECALDSLLAEISEIRKVIEAEQNEKYEPM